MLKVILSIMTTPQQIQMSNQLHNSSPVPQLQQFPPQFFHPQYLVVSPPLFQNQMYPDQQLYYQQHYASGMNEQDGRYDGRVETNVQQGTIRENVMPVHPGQVTAILNHAQTEPPANENRTDQEITRPTFNLNPTLMAASNVPHEHSEQQNPVQPRTPNRYGQSQLERASQRRRFDQITSTPDSVDTIDHHQKVPEPPTWDETNGWDDDDLSETACNIDFGDNNDSGTSENPNPPTAKTSRKADDTKGLDASMTEVGADKRPNYSTVDDLNHHE